MDRQLVDRLWFAGKAVPDAAFRLNGSVEVVSGEHAGHGGAVLSLVRLDPDPVYLVELASPPYDVHLS